MQKITEEDAREAINQLRNNWASMERTLLLLIATEAWTALGHSSFQEMFEKERLNEFKLSQAVRSKAIEVMRFKAPELSNRQIAAVLGVAGRTVDRDVSKITATNVAQNQEITNPRPDVSRNIAPDDAPTLPQFKPKPPVKKTPKPPVMSNPVATKPEPKVIDGRVTNKVHECPGCHCKPS
jgi:hypothetical protein